MLVTIKIYVDLLEDYDDIKDKQQALEAIKDKDFLCQLLTDNYSYSVTLED